MYVAVRDVMLFQAGYRTLAEGLEELDLNAVELAVSRDLSVLRLTGRFSDSRSQLTSAEAVEALRSEYDQAGIHISGLMLANNFNADDIEAEIVWTAEALRMAQGLGADAVRIDSAMTGQKELPRRERIHIYAQAVRRALDMAPDSEVPLGIENHGLQGNDPEWMQGVLDDVASPRLGLTLDTANFYWAGYPLNRVYEIIEGLAPHVKHTHCKNICFEPARRNIQRSPGWDYGDHVCPIPDGDVDHSVLAAILKDAGYAGGLNIEDESLGKFDEAERKAELRRDADHLAQVVEAVGGRRHYQNT